MSPDISRFDPSQSISHWNISSVGARRPLLKDSVKFQVQTQFLSLNVVKEEDIEKKGQNENEGDIEESQVNMVIDEDVDSDSQNEMENEKDLSDSEIESGLEEDIVFGKLFDYSRN